MNILIDAFGGDNAPLEVIQGAVRAVQELGVTCLLYTSPSPRDA